MKEIATFGLLTSLFIKFPNTVNVDTYLKGLNLKIIYLPCDFFQSYVCARVREQNE